MQNSPPLVHLCRFELEGPDAPPATWSAYLDAQDRERAEGFRFARDRERFERVRGALRAVLGEILGRDPRDLRLGIGPWGKPFLEDEALHFSVSHSGNWGLIACTTQAPLGIDVEQIRPLGDLTGLTRTAFTEVERASLETVPEDERTRAFFRLWTRKEAVAKALGEGLRALKRFDVSLDDPPRLLRMDADPADVARWRLLDLHDMPGHAGCLAVMAPDWQLRARLLA